jgi:hypothetical protein
VLSLGTGRAKVIVEDTDNLDRTLVIAGGGKIVEMEMPRIPKMIESGYKPAKLGARLSLPVPGRDRSRGDIRLEWDVHEGHRLAALKCPD